MSNKKSAVQKRQRLQKSDKQHTRHRTRTVDLAALSFCLRDSEKRSVLLCTFGTHDRDSPEPLRIQSSVLRQDSECFNGFIQNLHILYHGIFRLAIDNIHKMQNRIQYMHFKLHKRRLPHLCAEAVRIGLIMFVYARNRTSSIVSPVTSYVLPSMIFMYGFA